MAKKKRKLTAKQKAALAKGRRALAKKRRGKKNPAHRKKRATRRKVAPTHPRARAAIHRKKKRANPVKPSSRVAPHYVIKSGSRYFDGAGFTSDRRQAAAWKDLKRCRKIAQMVADATGKSCTIED